MNAPNDKSRPQCHFISNTHWDREWRYSMQRTRHMLVYMLDMLLDILDKEPGFKSFHLDSQAVPIQDYLEVRPERAELIRKCVREKRLLVGPWFILPDEFCVGGESLIRNLLLGHRIAKDLGHVSKTGYSPFSWGQISQMPQIYRGFGIPMAAFYRGVNTLVAPNSEFIWEGPDGSRLVGSRLAQRPRYNVWYVIQRPVYWGMADENERLVSWGAGHGPFRFAEPVLGDLDAQYAHPKYEYHAEEIAARARQAMTEQDGEWTTPHRFWSAGHDSSCPDIREARMIADCDAALADGADVFHSTFEDFQRSVCESVDLAKLPVIRGEMRHFFTPGSSSALYGWVTSARTDIKQDNYVTERALGVYAEPLAVFASLLGAPFPRGFLDRAWNWLLLNHGHDSIGGCSRDVVPNDMLFRSRQAREISACVTERALMDIAGSIDLSARSPNEVAVVAWNPTPQQRTEVAELVLDVPVELAAADLEIVDEAGNLVATQRIQDHPKYTIVQSPNDCANMMKMHRHRLHAELPDVPSMGYRTFFVKPLAKKVRRAKRTMLTAPQTIENEFLAVTVQPNGALAVTHKPTGRTWRDMGYFRDSSEIGNPWERHPVANDAVFTTLDARATVSVVREGELVTSLRVEIDWALPRGRSDDETHRHADRVPYRIVNTVTLRRGRPWVEIVTELNNTAQDHYLQVSFPTGVKADHVTAQTPFDVVTRPIARPDPAPFGEEPQTEHPMDRFVDISDAAGGGVALLNEGLKAYEAHEDQAATLSLTLLRCFPLRICVTALEMTNYSNLDNGSQCPGPQRFRYALLPHEGDGQAAGLWQQAERFCHDFRIVQIGPTPHGSQPRAKSFLQVEPGGLHVSGVKQSESGQGWIVRLFNPGERTVTGRLRLNGGFAGPRAAQSPVERIQASFALPAERGERWPAARIVSLEEIPESDLAVDPDGWVAFDIAAKKILTIELADK